MLQIVQLCLYAALIFILLAFVCDLIVVTLRHRSTARSAEAKVVPEGALVGASSGSADVGAGAVGAGAVGAGAVGAGAVGAGAGSSSAAVRLPADHPAQSSTHGLAWYGSAFAVLATVLLTVALVGRALVTGHGPFTNQHEFAVSFTWGVMAAYLFFLLRYRVRALSLVVLPVALALLAYALTTDDTVRPLIPALQNNFLLTTHVATAVLAYGAAGVAFGAAVLYLIRPKLHFRGLPSRDLLDEIGYRAGVLTFPLLTIMILLGAIWAEIAWGRYWSWDPKETAALVTWLIYGAYLHARVVRDWKGNRAAWLLILGFAAVLFTYFGNLFFGGMHSYA